MKTKIVNNKTVPFRVNAISAAMLLILFQNGVEANPNGAIIVNGQVSIDRSLENIATITNSPNAIINWKDFNISQNEITRFIQQNSQSAVLNRVIGQNPSQILGQLVSNGQVFLINPNGIVFGANSVINTQGMIASTLNLSNQDFLNGNYHFVAGNNAGSILNQGIIRAGEDGNIILIAPDIENSGIISTKGGQITLAAGSELTLTNLDSPEIQFQIQAPENKVLNLGEILTQGGAINLFAGSISHSGDLNANSVEIDKNGNINLVALEDITLDKQSIITANNLAQAGNISIESGSGTTTVSGTIAAKAKQGGKIHLLGEQVGLFDNANIDASGDNQGGEVLVGGDFQGNNPNIKNATAVYTGKNTQIHADAITEGNAGKVIVWADKTANIHGAISVKGGEESGDAGFVETSAKEHLTITQSPNISSKDGNNGEWLIDPNDIEIVAGTGNININNSNPFLSTADNSQLGVDLIETTLTGGANISITTSTGGSSIQNGNITLSVPLELNDTTGTNTLTLSAHNDIKLNEDINKSTDTSKILNLNLIADSDNDTNGAIKIADFVTLDTNGGTIDAKSTGSGKIFIIDNTTINAPLLAKEINIAPTSSTATINFNNTVTVDALNMDDGILSINDTTTIGSLNLDANNFGSTIMTSGTGILNLTGISQLKSDNGLMDFTGAGLTVNNSGTISYQRPSIEDDLLKLSNGVTFNNLSAGTFDFANDSDISNSTGIASHFNNEGILLKSAGTGESVIGKFGAVELNIKNGSRVDIKTGHIVAARGGSFSGTSTNTSSTPLRIGGASFNVLSNASTGSLEMFTGTSTFTGSDLTVTDLTLLGGTLTVNNNLTANNFNWIPGGADTTINGSGTLNITGAGDLKSDNLMQVSGLTINNTGTVVYSGNNQLLDLTNNAIFNNQTGAVFEFADDSDIKNSNTGTSSFNNKGTLRKTGGINDSVFGLFNPVTLNTFTGSNIDVQTGILTSKTTLTNNGIINTTTNSTFGVAGGNFTNSSTGTLQGSGTFDAPVSGLQNEGTISPGESSTAILNVKGNLFLSPSSKIDIGIEGNIPTTPEFDQINVTGNIDLGGTLNVSLPTAFDPILSNFSIITANSVTGTFTSSNPPSGYNMVTDITSPTVTLKSFGLLGDILWDNDSGDGLWTTLINWSTDTLPIATDSVIVNLGDSSSIRLENSNQTIDKLQLNHDLFINNAQLTVKSDFDASKKIDIEANGKLIVEDDLTGIGSINIRPSGTLELYGIHSHSLNIINDGVLNQKGGIANLMGNITNNTNGLINIDNELVIATSPWVNEGTINTKLNSTFFISSSTSDFTNKGILKGFGNIDAENVFNEGLIEPGASPGKLTFKNNLILMPSSNINLELAGISPSNYDQIQVDNTATLAGSLNVNEINGFTPTTDASFSLINCGTSCSGSFNSTSLPSTDYTATATAKSSGSQFTAPVVTDPIIVDPVVTDPIIVDPVVTDPIIVDPVVTDPVIIDPVVTDPVIIDPVVTDPVIVDPIVTDPIVVDPVVTDPIVTDPVVVDPVVSDPIIVDPIVTDPIIDSIVTPIVDPIINPPVVDPIVTPIKKPIVDPIIKPIIESVNPPVINRPKPLPVFQTKRIIKRKPIIDPEADVLPLMNNGSFQLSDSKETNTKIYLPKKNNESSKESDSEEEYVLEQCNTSSSDTSNNNALGIAQ